MAGVGQCAALALGAVCREARALLLALASSTKPLASSTPSCIQLEAQRGARIGRIERASAACEAG